MSLRWSWPSVTLSLVLTACGGDAGEGEDGPNRAPVIDSLDSSEEIAPSNGRYVAPIVVKFHDDDGDAITRLRVRIPDGGYDETTTVQRASPQATGATVTMDFDSSTVAPGTYEYLVSVFDSGGLESEPLSRTITFK